MARPSLHIIYRSCAVVKTLSKTSNRPFGLDKQTMILKSFKSLLESCMRSGLSKNIFIDIVDDSSPSDFRDKMKRIASSYRIIHNFHEISVKNNGKSLYYCYGLAENSKSDMIYFCEDDYLHLPNAIRYVMEAYEKRIVGHSNFCVHPTDYPDRYVKVYPSYIFLSSHCHWRSISQTTGTFFIPRKIFMRHIEKYRRFADMNSGKVGGGEEDTINKVYEQVPCLSPIPSLAAHLNDDTLPPFIDWKKEVDKVSV